MKNNLNLLATSASALIAQLLLQIVCGIILHLSYTPTVDKAHASVEAIRGGDALGQFLQNFHYWGSAFLIAHAFVHLALMVWNGLYRPPNTIRFVASLAVFLCAFLFQLTGNLLPMDRHDVQTAVVEAGIARSTPIVGPTAANLMLQGEQFNQKTLDAWYIAHRFLIPGLALLAIFAAISAHRRLKDSRIHIAGAVLPLLLIAVIAVASDAPSGDPAQPADFGEAGALVSWYTWPMHGALQAFMKISPGLGWIGAGVLPGLFIGFLVLLPLLKDRIPVTTARLTFAGFLFVFLGMAIGFGGSFAPLVGNQDPARIAVATKPAADIDKALAGKGKSLFGTLGCAACHGKEGVGGTGGPSLAKVFEKHPDADWYKKFIKNPQSVKPSSTMPSFEELKDDQLAALAEYLRSPR